MNHPSPPGPDQAASPPAPAYPIRPPAGGADPRFTIGLALDIADVLTRHGYPALTCGHDLAHWQTGLFTTIYHHGKESTS
jgi:hypothetical protein